MKKLNDNAKNFINCNTFIKKYNYLKNIFELFLKKGKYIEEFNIKDKYDKLNNDLIIQLNDDYFIEYYKEYFKIIKKVKIYQNLNVLNVKQYLVEY